MKINKLIIVIFLLLGYYTSYSQAPGDPSCYTGVYGCVSWSNWVPHTEYMKFQQFGNCQLYAIVYTRYCINDPNNIEMFIYQFGCIPPTLGENCQYFRQSLFPNWPNEDVVNYDFAQTVQMAMYRQIAINMSNQLKLEHICNEDEPLKYSMWFPGSCTMFCIYKRTGQENDYYLEEKACYDDYCCGKVYWMCWDDNLGQWNITEYQMGNDEGNCDEPTGNPPDWRCSAAKEGYSWIGASHCHNSCEYSTE